MQGLPPSLPIRWLSRGVVVLNENGYIVGANDAFAAWIGKSPLELQGVKLSRLLRHRHTQWAAAMDELLRRQTSFADAELAVPPNKDRQGENLRVEICRAGAHTLVRMESTPAADSDLRSRVAQPPAPVDDGQLKRAQAQLNSLIHRWPGIIFTQRPDFSFEFISPRIEELTGIPVEDLRVDGNLFWRVVHEADVEGLKRRLQKSDPAPREILGNYRLRHIKTGRVTYISEHRQPLCNEQGTVLGYDGVWQDITRQTLAERRLINMSWKENLGTIAMGLTHDFCNIMTGIVSLSETFEAEVTESSPLRNGLNLIRSTATQAGELARRIRQLHQGAPGEKDYQDLNETVSSLANILQKVLSRRVRLRTVLADDGPLPVYLDGFELRQVIVNLALNAGDAMPEGGDLVLRTSRHEQPPVLSPCTASVCEQYTNQANDHEEAELLRICHGVMPQAPLVCLSVEDSGSGISSRHLNSIFDPFFTTKPLGKGSGLGLYNVRLFAEKHGVAITVETRLKKGTAFHLWFSQANFTEAQKADVSLRGKRHTILVVGTAGEALDGVAGLLRQSGYYAVTATTEEEAVESLHSPGLQITGLLLLHLGEQPEALSLCRRIRDEKLSLKTFLSFAEGQQEETNATLLHAVDAVVPFDLPSNEFLARLKAVLDKP